MNARRVAATVLALAVCCLTATTDHAQTPAQSHPPLPKVDSVRVYVLDCGIQFSYRPEIYNLTREEIGYLTHWITCFLVMHPKGILLFDSGLSDKLVGRPFYENTLSSGSHLYKTTTLSSELAKIGVTPSMITYYVISHSNFDHVSNANDYAGSIWLSRKAEYDFMFGPESASNIVREEYQGLLKARTQFIEGDYDVFGDGSVILLSTPGHTPGHQSLYVKMAKTGGVVIAGDLYHRIAERTLNRMPTREQTRGTPESRQKVEAFLTRTNSQLWIGHDIIWYRDAVKSPGWYE